MASSAAFDSSYYYYYVNEKASANMLGSSIPQAADSVLIEPDHFFSIFLGSSCSCSRRRIAPTLCRPVAH
jgi:hypothetical protein